MDELFQSLQHLPENVSLFSIGSHQFLLVLICRKMCLFFLLVLINFCWFSFAGKRFSFFLLVLIITWCRSDLLSGKLDHKQLFHLSCFFYQPLQLQVLLWRTRRIPPPRQKSGTSCAGVYNLLLLLTALLLLIWSTAANEFELYLWDMFNQRIGFIRCMPSTCG